MKVYIYTQCCVRGGDVCYNEDYYSDCVEFDESDIPFLKAMIRRFAANGIRNSNEAYEYKKYYNALKELSGGEVKNLREV